MSARVIEGHVVTVTVCDGLRDHWRIEVHGRFVGLVAHGIVGWRALPTLRALPGCECLSPCDCGTADQAIAYLVNGGHQP